jgi:hypothetical protein
VVLVLLTPHPEGGEHFDSAQTKINHQQLSSGEK